MISKDAHRYYPYAIGSRYNYGDYEFEVGHVTRYYKFLKEEKKKLVHKYKYYYRIKKRKQLFRDNGIPDVSSHDMEMGYNYMFRNRNNGECFNKNEPDYAICMINNQYLNFSIHCIEEQLCYINANLKAVRQHTNYLH